ncbi:unnamed protein product [Linum tenue]|uniref:Uncharacterized protein n=1 Tax=Linum tenue TaxID=586396 RepID=A0AAV0L8M7_9ROSI|nr:unnamed protein product [Linum tenue]
MGKGTAKQCRVKKVLQFPARLLVRARDFYVNGMSQLSDQMRCGAVSNMGCPAHMGTAALPRSFSVGSGSTNPGSDYSELIRAASVRQSPAAVKASSGMVNVNSGGAGKVSRSYSVGLGRIEEEEKCDGLGEDDFTFSPVAFHRSRSCAVSAAGGVLGKTTTGRFQKTVAAASVA